MGASAQRCYLLLMRHGASRRTAGQDGEACAMGLSKEGHADVRDVGHGLADALSGLRDSDATTYGIDIHVLLHGTSDLATQTAEAVHEELTRCGGFEGDSLPAQEFNGQHASPWSGDRYASEEGEASKLLDAQLAKAGEAGHNAVVVVGHQPLLGILARQRTGQSVPLARAEVACLAGDPASRSGWRLQWTITPREQEVMQQLREKIVAKMTVAGVIGSVIAAGLVLLLDGLFSQPATPGSLSVNLRYSAAVCLFVATWLYLATVYHCDRLLMPTRFWGEATHPAELDRRPRWLVWRPPGSAAWVIYQNMQRVWSWFFVPATYLVVFGALLLGVALWNPPDLARLALRAIPFAAGAAILLGYSVWRRPHLGVED
jgi:phosphohistidine phosphatase SixA